MGVEPVLPTEQRLATVLTHINRRFPEFLTKPHQKPALFVGTIINYPVKKSPINMLSHCTCTRDSSLLGTYVAIDVIDLPNGDPRSTRTSTLS